MRDAKIKKEGRGRAINRVVLPAAHRWGSCATGSSLGLLAPLLLQGLRQSIMLLYAFVSPPFSLCYTAFGVRLLGELKSEGPRPCVGGYLVGEVPPGSWWKTLNTRLKVELKPSVYATKRLCNL